jgi:diguanylate cyclase (GGDEF)-like protein
MTVASLALWRPAFFRAEVLVSLISLLVAYSAPGFRGAIGVILAYVFPTSYVYLSSQAVAADWAGLLLVSAFLATSSYYLGGALRRERLNARRRLVYQALRLREMRQWRKTAFAVSHLGNIQGSREEILSELVCQVSSLQMGSGAGVWTHDGGRLQEVVKNNWPEEIAPEALSGFGAGDSGHELAGYSVLQVPLTERGASTFLAWATPTPSRKGRANMAALRAVAQSASAALSRLDTLASSKRQSEYLELLTEVGQSFASNLSLEDLFSSIYREVRRIMVTDAFFVALYDEESQVVDLRYIFEDGVRLDPIRISLNDGPTSRAIKTRAPVLHNVESTQIPGVNITGKPTSSTLIVPIILQDKVIGALSAQGFQRDTLDEDDTRILSTIASQAAIALQNAQLYEQTLALALTDSMTGLKNARALHVELEEALKRAKVRDEKLSLIMIDSDSLKSINDRFGHLAGDEHICRLAGIIRERVRTGDVVARYAGDEFMILLPNTPLAEARTIAQRIIQSVRAVEYEALGQTVSVTASAGVAEFPRDADTEEQLIQAADRALYHSKENGKNRMTSTDELDRIAN